MAVVLFVTIMTVSAWAVPTIINFQGKLADPDGVSVPDGSYTMRFVIYDDVAPGGTLLWQEDQSVPVAEGIYNVQLGYVTVFPADLFDNAALYLEVRVYNQGTSSWETLEPRQQLTSTAFSMKAAKAEDAELLEGFSAGSFVGASGGTMTGPLSVPSLEIDGITAFRAPGDNTYVGLSTGSSSGASNTLIGNQSGYQLTTGSRNTFVGKDSGYSTTSGARNVFLGHDAGTNNQTGFENTFVGESAGRENVDGDQNTFIGRYAGRANETGSANTYIGQGAGYYSPAGDENVFVGIFAGQGNSTGSKNTFLGSYAGEGNGDGMENTFVGYHAGDHNMHGDFNTFVGRQAGYNNTEGDYNTFIGPDAGYSNTTGDNNTYIGRGAGYWSTEGIENVFVGKLAGIGNGLGSHNTFVGTHTGFSNTDGINNTYLGHSAGRSNNSGNGNVFLGHQAGYNETGSDKLYIANSDTSTPLIHGDFQTQELTVNGKLTVSGGVKFPDGTVQNTAAAPTWHQILPAADRFELVMGGEAVLDKETGLVWERSPHTFPRDWVNAIIRCYTLELAHRKGFRMPTLEELASLVDTLNEDPALPSDHPFINVQSDTYWASTTVAHDTLYATSVSFNDGSVYYGDGKAYSRYVWCVRGGQGHDGW